MSDAPLLDGVRREWGGGPAAALDPFEAPEFYDGIRSRRVLAYLIDVVLLVVAWTVWWIVGGALALITLGLLKPFLALGSVLLPFAYHTWFIGGEAGATPGMRAMGLRAVTTEGTRPSYLQAFILTALFYFSVSVTGWLILLLSLFSDRGRCLHDFLAGVLILRADALPRVPYSAA